MKTSDRKEEILKVAVEIIHTRGFYRLTIRNIAKKILISEAAIYRHFENKEAIISELCTKIFSRNRYWLEDLPSENPYDLLHKIMMNQLEILREEPYLSAVLFHEEIFREYPVLKERIRKHRDRNEKTIQNIIHEGQIKGIISRKISPSVFAILYMGSIRMIVLKWRQSDFFYPMEEEAEKVLKQLFFFARTSDQ